MRSISRMLGGLVLGLLLVIPAGAQSESAGPPVFGEIVDVRVINLEIVVTDRKQRVEGLTSDDFRLLVDGQEVPIEYFTEVRSGQAVPTEGRSEASAVPALEPGETVGTRYLVFIDDSFTIPAQRNRVLRKLAEQVHLMGPRDHMAVVAFDGKEIDLLTSWTRSLPELERVFEEARQRKAYGLFNYNRRIDQADFYGLRSFGADPFDRVGYRDSIYRNLLATPRGSRSVYLSERIVEAAATTLRGFAKPPGRKVMILLSGGWPTSGRSAYNSLVSYAGSRPDWLHFAPLVDTANRLGYTVYPVDVQGLQAHFGDARYATFDEARIASELQLEREWVEEGALVHLARETGGRALLDGASLRALERTIDDTRSYYWLGFTPNWREDDRRHQVKVEMKQRGLKVRSRKSFSDLSRQTEVTMLVESSQVFDLPIPGESPDLAVSIGEPRKGGYKKVIVPLKLEIPLDQVTALPQQDGYVAELELRVAVTDDRGDSADIPVIPVELRSQEAPRAGETGFFEVSLKLRKRPHELLVSIHDPVSGAILSKRIDVTL